MTPDGFHPIWGDEQSGTIEITCTEDDHGPTCRQTSEPLRFTIPLHVYESVEEPEFVAPVKEKSSWKPWANGKRRGRHE